jgi:hypothetical protein
MKKTIRIELALGVALGLFAFACDDSATVVGPEPAAGGSGSVAAAGTGNAAGTAGAGGADPGAGGSGGGTAACVEDPTEPADFLVRCTNSTCRPFDNAQRLGLYVAGEPLPEVP